MKRLLLFVVLVALSGCTYARGEKIGTITKIAEQGALCTSFEGQIIRGGMSSGSGAFGAPFDFTIPKDRPEMLDAMRSFMETGQEVKLHYYSYGPTFCSSDSGHFVTKVEPLSRSPLESASGLAR